MPSFTVYYGIKISYYFAIKEWNDFIFELQFFDNKSEHIYFVLEIFLKYIIIFYIFDQPGDWWVAAGGKYCGWHQDYSAGLSELEGGTVFWMEFYVDIFWESRCSSEIKVWGHLCQILVVYEVPARPQVKGMSGNS